MIPTRLCLVPEIGVVDWQMVSSLRSADGHLIADEQSSLFRMRGHRMVHRLLPGMTVFDLWRLAHLQI